LLRSIFISTSLRKIIEIQKGHKGTSYEYNKMMLPVLPLSVCCLAALLAVPAHGLMVPQTQTTWKTHRTHNWGYSRHNNHPRGVLFSALQESDDNSSDKVESSISEGSTTTTTTTQQTMAQEQQQPEQPQQPQQRSNNNPTKDQSITQAMALMGTSPRRIFLSLTSSTTIALAANIFGITSNLLSALPEEAVEASGLDSFYPRGEYKRVTVRGTNLAGMPSGSGKSSFLIPKDWVADTGLALAQAQRQSKALDYSMASSAQSKSVLPDAAYGPPGRLDSQGLSNGDTNVSVIVNNGVRNFRLASLGNGDAISAAEAMLASRPRPTSLVTAVEELRGRDDATLLPVYQFEYTVDRGEKAKQLRAISVVAGSAGGDAFVTLTVVSPDEEWEKPGVGEKLRKIAQSFKLV